jgi:hypothetical protein
MMKGKERKETKSFTLAARSMKKKMKRKYFYEDEGQNYAAHENVERKLNE